MSFAIFAMDEDLAPVHAPPRVNASERTVYSDVVDYLVEQGKNVWDRPRPICDEYRDIPKGVKIPELMGNADFANLRGAASEFAGEAGIKDCGDAICIQLEQGFGKRIDPVERWNDLNADAKAFVVWLWTHYEF